MKVIRHVVAPVALVLALAAATGVFRTGTGGDGKQPADDRAAPPAGETEGAAAFSRAESVPQKVPEVSAPEPGESPDRASVPEKAPAGEADTKPSGGEAEAAEPSGAGPTEQWAVQLAPGSDPGAVAASVGAQVYRPVTGLEGYYVVEAEGSEKGAEKARMQAALTAHPAVLWSEQQVARAREKRTLPVAVEDPLFGEQWHLWNDGQEGALRGEDGNVPYGWAEGRLGSGIVVAVVDDGLEGTHPDLAGNVLAGLGYDYLDGDSDPSPESTDDSHGTAVAGIVAARDNALGIRGVAPRAGLAGIRMLGDGITDAQEASSLGHARDTIDVYNNSWGPTRPYDGPDGLARQALTTGRDTGRGGLGNLFVWAAGNSAEDGDRADYDGYLTRRETIAVGAMGADGQYTSYSEPGACVLVSAPSRGTGGPGIVTTDLTGSWGLTEGSYTETGLFSGFGGTSAAAPYVSGALALLLEERPELSWRDVQHLLVKSATRVDRADSGWRSNAVGHRFHPRYGFGRVDVRGLLALAREWRPRGPEVSYTNGDRTGSWSIPDNSSGGVSVIETVPPGTRVRIENVLLYLETDHPDWSELRIELVSPGGTTSVLTEPFQSTEALAPGQWEFRSVQFWDEAPAGDWRVRVSDLRTGNTGQVTKVRLAIYGEDPPEPENVPPDVIDDSVVPAQARTAIDVLFNDYDYEGDPLRVISLYRPAGGRAEITAEGTVLYTADDENRGTFEIGYLASDGHGGTDKGFVDVNLTTPIARDDAFGVVSGEAPVLLDVTGNDEHPFGFPIALESVGPTGAGAAVSVQGGEVVYAPLAGWRGVDRFAYTLLEDLRGYRDEGEVQVTVLPTANFALELDGENDHVLIANPGGLLTPPGPLSIEAWIRPEGWGENGVLGFGRILDGEDFLLFVNGSGHADYPDHSLVFYLVQAGGATAAAYSPEGSLELGRWQHVAVTYDGGGTVRLYVDGEEVPASHPFAPPTSAVRPGAEPVRLGESSGLTRAFEGALDEVRLWHTVRTPGEIAANRWADVSGASGLAGYWPLRAGAGADVAGEAGGFGGTVQGQARWVEGPANLFTYDPPRESGGVFSPWMGAVEAGGFPKIVHEQMGALTVGEGSTEENLYLHADDLGWMWTSASLFARGPFLYRYDTQSWVYFQSAGCERGPRVYDYGTQVWSER